MSLLSAREACAAPFFSFQFICIVPFEIVHCNVWTSPSASIVPFQIVHCDVWTSPAASVSGYRYYLVLLDDFSHYCWTFPLIRKSKVHTHLAQFCIFVQTQFRLPIKCFQADNGTEFVNYDNVSAVYMTADPVHHYRTKHIGIDIHFVRKKVALGQVRVLHVPSSHQFTDIMTRGLHVQLFTEFRSSLCVHEPPAATASRY